MHPNDVGESGRTYTQHSNPFVMSRMCLFAVVCFYLPFHLVVISAGCCLLLFALVILSTMLAVPLALLLLLLRCSLIHFTTTTIQ
jgi:hypothetical protein